jgi:hypothetical protein
MAGTFLLFGIIEDKPALPEGWTYIEGQEDFLKLGHADKIYYAEKIYGNGKHWLRATLATPNLMPHSKTGERDLMYDECEQHFVTDWKQ